MRLFIDPGHGGKDSGAIGPTGFEEKVFNFHVAELLELACHYAGWDTMWSRDHDVNVSELQSALNANAWEADYYVSIHANGAGPQAHGCEVLYWNGSSRGAAWAGQLQDELLSRFPQLRNRGTKPKFPGDRGATVLRRTNMPAVLIEPAFITNVTEEAFLRKFSTQAMVADAIWSSLDSTIHP